jgi:glycogen debranching enzyme
VEDIIRVKDHFYILATSSRVDATTRVLKEGETFAVFDRYGDIEPVGSGELGLYHEGTRFLSRLSLTLEGTRPLLLSSTIKEDNSLLSVDLTNPDFSQNGQVLVPRGTVHLLRSKFLWRRACYERLVLHNYSLLPIELHLQLGFDADFADLFEIRGLKRERRGRISKGQVEGKKVVLRYQGLDGIQRNTILESTPSPEEVSPSCMKFRLWLAAREEVELFLTIACELASDPPTSISFPQGLAELEEKIRTERAKDCQIYTSNEQFNDWINRSVADLHMMITDTESGPYPYAGVPWFSAPFGRDGIITALQYLWVNPDIARGVLNYLAAHQATRSMPEVDAEPGKIMHEARKGEMAALNEIPFGRYYGSVDATPLFVILAGAYFQRTGDLPFIHSLWPHIELALEWVDKYGDADGDGFVEYCRRCPKGLVHQGWKDSKDSVFHADGRLAEGPIALCEVQGYVYAAKQAAAQLALALGQAEKSKELSRQAFDLQRRFHETFWSEDLSLYVLALDGEKKPCQVRTSNAGQCLFTGIASEDHARRIASTLMGEDFFSGWGIRTVCSSEIRYNPSSYHNGSVWPHDNALIAYGFARYGLKQHALRVMAGLFDASLFVDLHRLPELFCGFPRRPGQGPTLYPVACSPQSWASASVFLLLQSCLGLTIDAPRSQISFDRPTLPEFLQEVQIRKLKVKQATVDLSIQRREKGVSITILEREGQVHIVE